MGARIASVPGIMAGMEAAPCCDAAKPLRCPLCFAVAVLPLDAETLAKQPDDTTHVCYHPIGGCNHGFALVENDAARQTKARRAFRRKYPRED